MRWSEVAERALWRTWQAATGMAVAAMLVWGGLRWDALGDPSGRAACSMGSRPQELLPPECWLRSGLLGIPAGALDLHGSLRVSIMVAAIAGVAALVFAGSSPRRQRSLNLCGLAWSIGLWVSVWAAEHNANLDDGFWWAARIVVWSPAAVATVLVVCAWLHSPWRTLESPGLRSARLRRQRARAEERWSLPDVSQIPASVRLHWPVPGVVNPTRP